jgi:hypothetical protein
MGTRSLGSVGGALVLLAVSVTAAYAQSAEPITQPDLIEVEEDKVVVGYPLLNDSDPGGGVLELVSVLTTPAGVARIDGTAVVFTPTPDWTGESELTYTVRSAGGSTTGLITIIVHNINDAPFANDDSASVVGSGSVAVDVLANDTDVDGDVLVIGTVNSPANGMVTVEDGIIEYTASDGFSGDDTFAYRVFDPAGESAEALVTIQVTVAVSPGAVPSDAPSTTLNPVGTEPAISSEWAAPPVSVTPTPGDSEGFLGALLRHLGTLLMPLLLLCLTGVTAWIMSQRDRMPGRKYAVVLVGRGEVLGVHERASHESAVMHRYEYSSRQIDVIGRRRVFEGVEWLPVSTSSGQGWVESHYLTEDVARTTFESDLAEGDIVRELRRRLREGATISTSSRGVIDPEAFSRDGERQQLGRNATARLAALLGDWRASFHVDETASIAALRPPQLRNLHWVSFEAPDLDPWQLFFEYRDGRPHPVAALPENVSVPA